MSARLAAMVLLLLAPALGAAQPAVQAPDSGSVRFRIQEPDSLRGRAAPRRLPGTPPIRPLERQGESLSLARQLLQLRRLMARDPDAALERLEALSLRHPDQQQLRLQLGQVYRLTGRLDDSERVLRGLLDEFPEASGYLSELARTLLRAGRDDEALELVHGLYAVGVPRAGRYEEAAALLLGASRIRLAEDIYQEGLSALPREDERGRLRLVRRLFELHALEDDPVRILALLAEREPEFEDPGLERRLLNYAEQFLAESEHPARTLALADSLAAEDASVPIAEVLREIYFAVGDPERFAEQVLRAPVKPERRADWLHDEGLRCLEDNRGDAAVRRRAAAELFSAGLASPELDPVLRSKLRFQLARIRLDQDADRRLRGERPAAEDVAELRRLLRDLRTENPGSFWAMRALSEELRFLREREHEAAEADALLRAWLLEPERARGTEIEAALELELGENLLAGGRFAEARRHYEGILAAHRNRNAMGWAGYRLAQLLALDGELQAAQDSLAGLAKADPSGALANDALEMALVLAESMSWPETVRGFLDASLKLEIGGDLPGAARHLQAFAVEFPEDPASPALLYRAGRLYLRALMGAEALESWLLLADTHPEDFRAPQSLEQAARLAERLGRRARARELLDRILQEHPRFPLRPALRDLQARLEEDA